jgi:glutamate synthase (NADPH) small chain
MEPLATTHDSSACTACASRRSTILDSKTVKFIAGISLVLFAGIELYFFKLHYSVAGYAGYALLLIFGIWRIVYEKNAYQKFRISFILISFFLLWGVIPLAFDVKIPIIGGTWGNFPAIHTIGSLVFFGYFGVVLLFGKRVDCGWCCPCVTARETIAYPFRHKTPRNKLWWWLRHLKWVSVALLLAFLGFTIFDAATAYDRIGKFYYDYVTYPYYASFLLIPLTGNRNFCRILCPFAGLWGLLSYLGFYRIKADKDACIDCKKCEKVCDMGIPITRLIKEKGQIRTVECIGCGRCVNVCPKKALEIHDVRNFLKNFHVHRRSHAEGKRIDTTG